MKVLVCNGPNLGRLGAREPAVYGVATHDDLERRCVELGRELGIEVEVRQSDHEGELVGWLHQAADERLPVVLNAGAWTHYSIAVRDAAAQLTAPMIEVHISNVYRREQFRHTSVLSDIAAGVIAGLGIDGYLLALRWLSANAESADNAVHGA